MRKGANIDLKARDGISSVYPGKEAERLVRDAGGKGVGRDMEAREMEGSQHDGGIFGDPPLVISPNMEGLRRNLTPTQNFPGRLCLTLQPCRHPTSRVAGRRPRRRVPG